MKGKIAFVLGAAVGYVFGSRAGRERYEQIKRGAQSVWNTPPVQRGVGAVRGAVQGQIDRVKDKVVAAGRDAFTALTGTQAKPGAASSSSDATSRPVDGDGAA